MVIPEFTFSNYFFLGLGAGDALGKKNIIKTFAYSAINSDALQNNK